jgi:hypothetical protein
MFNRLSGGGGSNSSSNNNNNNNNNNIQEKITYPHLLKLWFFMFNKCHTFHVSSNPMKEVGLEK